LIWISDERSARARARLSSAATLPKMTFAAATTRSGGLCMATGTDYRDVVSETNLFSGVGDKILDQIVEAAKTKDYRSDEVIYQPGDDAIDIYLLLSGLVRFSLAPGAKPQSGGTVMRSRMIFGWAALVPEHPRWLAKAQCIEPSKLLIMNGDRVLSALRDNPASGFKVMERLCTMIARNFMEERSL
jgi:CRP-like cAMP-binding protein